jgi:tetratricopeptide (TPR) repeat protein
MAKSLLDGASPRRAARRLACHRADERAPAPLERCRRRALTRRAAGDQEGRPHLFVLPARRVAERQKHDQAEQFFRQALNLDPENAMTLNYLGYMWADKGIKLPDALKMIRKAVDLEPMNGAYLDSLGWVYFKMGEYELAEDNLRQAVNRDQTDPTVHMHLGDLYEKTGRIRLAAAQWQLSLDELRQVVAADIEPATWPRCRRSSKARARSWPKRTVRRVRPNLNKPGNNRVAEFGAEAESAGRNRLVRAGGTRASLRRSIKTLAGGNCASTVFIPGPSFPPLRYNQT